MSKVRDVVKERQVQAVTPSKLVGPSTLALITVS